MIGASVWPMNTLAAAASDSDPETPISRCIIFAINKTTRCMTPM